METTVPLSPQTLGGAGEGGGPSVQLSLCWVLSSLLPMGLQLLGWRRVWGCHSATTTDGAA